MTIAEIAAAARVAEMTVTNYFPRKEDLALDYHGTFTAGLARAVTCRAESESALAALRRDFLAALERHDAVAGFSGAEFARMVTDSPTLTARLRELHDLREEALARALAAETASSGGDLVPRAAAALLATAHRVLFQQVMDLTLAGRSNQEITAAVTRSAQEVFGLLEPSLGGYAVCRGRS
ncbi:hypothetical protein M878_14185 [Streptomyces roseochromogenus subsp. oscitans DS 12.976]|uniref:Uncharacterized protein n=1 Tax=Streptomyces roseochromogenus subsp. oscitans DS 12.976 TaxID=1352936 RepID=V6KKL3_STRRC|nr:hypothetical protein M878_14185 [Streptomyces roseochromogenus subsp. oscitans DS 12.976]